MPNVAQDFLVVTQRVNELEQALRASEKQVKALEAASKSATNQMTRGYGGSAQVYKDIAKAMRDAEKAAKDLRGTQAAHGQWESLFGKAGGIPEQVKSLRDLFPAAQNASKGIHSMAQAMSESSMRARQNAIDSANMMRMMTVGQAKPLPSLWEKFFGPPGALEKTTTTFEAAATRVGKAQQYMSAPMGSAIAGANQQRFAVFQLTSGLQDAAIAFQMMGNTTQGWSMAMRGASNNLGVMLSTMGPLAAILGTIALAVGPPVIEFLINLIDKTKEYTVSAEKLIEVQKRLSGVFTHNIELKKELDEATRTIAEEVGGQKPDTEARADVLKDYMKDEQSAMELRNKTEEEFLGLKGKEAQETLRIMANTEKEAKDEARRKEMARIESEKWEGIVVKTGPGKYERLKEGPLYEAEVKRRINEAEQRAVRKLYKDEPGFFGGEGKETELGKQRREAAAELEKARRTAGPEAAKAIADALKTGDYSKLPPDIRAKLEGPADVLQREKEHAELVRKWRQARERVESTRGAMAGEAYEGRVAPLEAERKEIELELRMKGPQREARREKLHLPKMGISDLKKRRNELDTQIEDMQRAEEARKLERKTEKTESRRIGPEPEPFAPSAVGPPIPNPANFPGQPSEYNRELTDIQRAMLEYTKRMALSAAFGPIFGRNNQM